MAKIWCVWLAMNVLAFALYGADKAKAKRHAWRISEKVLLLCGIAGGALGALLAMRLFHHKTKHWYFVAINTVALFIQIGLLIWLSANYPALA